MGTTRESAASPSESEDSFVSAELENTSSSSSRVRRDIDQSAPERPPPLPLPPPGSSSSSSSRHEGHKHSTSVASTSPTRTGRAIVKAQRDPAVTPLASQNLPAPLSPPGESYFTAQPGSTSGFEPRSPVQRRPPASRSSHGIETHLGPPPALSTQRSYNAESPWRKQAPPDPAATPKSLPQRKDADESVDSVLKATRYSTHDRRNSAPSRVNNGTHLLSSVGSNSAAGMTYQNESHSLEEDEDPTLRLHGPRMASSRKSGQDGQEQPHRVLPEDLFLDLARGDSVADDTSEVMSKSERRRSRLVIQPRASRPPSISGRPSTSGAQFPSHQTNSFQPQENPGSTLLDQSPGQDPHATLRNEIKRNRPYAASAHPTEDRTRARQRNLNEKASFSSPLQTYSPEAQRAIGRRRSMQATSPGVVPQAYKSQNVAHISKQSRYTSPNFAAPSQHGDGTESTVSTTAASTVWDELDDMKSRIRQLELTGKLPQSSNAAISSALGDRPATAGTTMTTLSSSPKRRQRQSISPETGTIRGPDISEVHPLLNSALGKAKDNLNANVYRILEASATDALTLAAMTKGAGAAASGIERQLRRKAESMCRYLTELCIALAEEKSDSHSPGLRFLSGSRNGTPPAHRNEIAQDTRMLRGVSEDPELRASSRVMSRLESRRTSLLGSSSSYSPREPSQEPPTPTQSTTTLVSKLDRTSLVRRRRENDEESKARRPPSRATTEVGQIRRSPQTRVSREYISNHPMPNSSQRSPSVQSSLPARKSHFSIATNSPLTPNNVQPGNRRYLQSSTPPSSSENTRLAEARQRRLASLGQLDSASQPRVGRLRQPESEK